MQESTIKRRPYAGVLLCILFTAIFLAVDTALSTLLSPHIYGAQWSVISSVVRLLFGIIVLFVFVRVFKKGSWTNVINLINFRSGLQASSGAITLTLFLFIHLALGVKSYVDTTMFRVVANLLFVQITTGLFEELLFRATLLEGYFTKEERTWKDRLKYALLSFFVFGLVHMYGCNDFGFAIYRFFITGMMGYVYAAIYLHSRNIVVPMLMHFIYDIPANATNFVAEWNQTTVFIIWDNYVYFIAIGAMLILSTIYLIKPQNN